MNGIKAWWQRWRQLRQAEREAAAAYVRWRRADYAYHDTAEVFGGQPGAWGGQGSIGKAQDDVTEALLEYRRLRAEAERLREVGSWPA